MGFREVIDSKVAGFVPSAVAITVLGQVSDNIMQAIAEGAEFAHAEVVRISPVDSGEYRKNHIAAVGAQPKNYTPHDGPSVAGPPTTPKLKPELDQDLWVVNNAPHAARLEQGWSRSQAPKGIYRPTTAKVKRVLAEKIRAKT